MPAELEYKITKTCGVLSTSARGWTKELNYVFSSMVMWLNLCRINGHGCAKDKICFFSLLVRVSWSG